MVGNFYMY